MSGPTLRFSFSSLRLNASIFALAAASSTPIFTVADLVLSRSRRSLSFFTSSEVACALLPAAANPATARSAFAKMSNDNLSAAMA